MDTYLRLLGYPYDLQGIEWPVQMKSQDCVNEVWYGFAVLFPIGSAILI